jgi:hypothetical protein
LTRTQRQIEAHRKSDAVVPIRDDAGRPCPGVAVWVEQESHEFRFGCVPSLDGLSETERTRYQPRLAEAFNCVEPVAGARRVDVMERTHLGALRLRLDERAAGSPLDVHVCGETVGIAELDERESAGRLAELYTLCFAHAAVRGVFWHGLWDGEEGARGGLLRQDLSPRPAFRVLHKLIDVVWHTRADGVTDADGLFRFRGFFGGYRVGAAVGGQVRVASFALRSGAG